MTRKTKRKRRYRVIMADPPWAMSDVDRHYAKMSVEDICGLGEKVKGLCSRSGCVLFLWVVRGMLPEGMRVVEAWGFRFVTVAFTWVKLTKTGKKFDYGQGEWTRGNPEDCWLCVRGDVKARRDRRNKGVPQLVFAPNYDHSAKPLEVRKRIERLLGKVARIELFARGAAKGWDSWGLEAEYGREEL